MQSVKISLMRYMAIDYGDARIGVAISDKTLQISGRAETIKNNGRPAVEKIVKLCETEEVTNIIIGFPLNANGTKGAMCEKVVQFGETLETFFPDGSIRIEYRDERRTTIASESILIEANISRKKRKEFVDGLAAKIILQKFLDEFNSNIKKSF